MHSLVTYCYAKLQTPCPYHLALTPLTPFTSWGRMSQFNPVSLWRPWILGLGRWLPASDKASGGNAAGQERKLSPSRVGWRDGGWVQQPWLWPGRLMFASHFLYECKARPCSFFLNPTMCVCWLNITMCYKNVNSRYCTDSVRLFWKRLYAN